MDEKKLEKGFSDADFMELTKDDPEAVTKYKKEVIELYSRRIYSQDQLIVLVTGKTKREVYGNYSLPELMRLNWALDFLTDNPCGDLYINRLVANKSKK